VLGNLREIFHSAPSIIAASAGSYLAMNAMRSCFENGIDIDRESLDSTLTAYNTSCGEMRGEARDAYICSFLGKYESPSFYTSQPQGI